MKQKKPPPPFVEKSDSVLPNPYGEDSTFGQGGESALSRSVRTRDSQRKFWTRAAILNGTPSLRLLLAAVVVPYATLLLAGWKFAIDGVGVALFVALSVLCIPTLLASAFAQMSARDRLQLKAGGKRSLEAYPGVERILNTLHERVLRERTRLLCALVAAFSINSVGNFDTGTTLASLLYGLAVFLGAIALLNALKLEQGIPMRNEDFPLLSLHAPTLHQSTLDRVLSDFETLRRRYRRTRDQLHDAETQNEKLVHVLHESKQQIELLKEEVDKLCAPPNTYGVFMRANKDGTAELLAEGRPMRVNVHPDVDIFQLEEGRMVVLNEAFNVVEAAGYVQRGETVKLPTRFGDFELSSYQDKVNGKKIDYDIWYDEKKRWVKIKFFIKNSIFEYFLVTEY